MEELVAIITGLEKRIEALELLVQIKNLTLPTDGKLVVDNRAIDPTGTNGRIYYNTTSNVFRVYENGAWRDMG